MTTPRIFLAFPCGHGHPNILALEAFQEKATRGGNYDLARFKGKQSGALKPFNHPWTLAVANREKLGLTDYALLCADVVPADWWLDTLHAQRMATQADLLSAVIAIKDGKGLTSTAVGYLDDPWDYVRITQTELMELPEVFGIDDIPPKIRRGRDCLLVNNGCFILNLCRPWWSEQRENGEWRFGYRIRDRIRTGSDGFNHVEFAPEDWEFSREVARAGGKVMATRSIRTIHFGEYGFGSDTAWGTILTDSECAEYQDKRRQELLGEGRDREEDFLARSECDDESGRPACPDPEPAAV